MDWAHENGYYVYCKLMLIKEEWAKRRRKNVKTFLDFLCCKYVVRIFQKQLFFKSSQMLRRWVAYTHFIELRTLRRFIVTRGEWREKMKYTKLPNESGSISHTWIRHMSHFCCVVICYSTHFACVAFVSVGLWVVRSWESRHVSKEDGHREAIVMFLKVLTRLNMYPINPLTKLK